MSGVRVRADVRLVVRAAGCSRPAWSRWSWASRPAVRWSRRRRFRCVPTPCAPPICSARTTAWSSTPTRTGRSQGALVAASWAFERGIGFQAPLATREVVTETGADGRYEIPRLDTLPSGLSTRVRRFTADRLSPRPRRLAQRLAVSQPHARPRLQPARQPRAAREVAADLSACRAPGVPGRRRAHPHGGRLGSAGRGDGARGRATGEAPRAPARSASLQRRGRREDRAATGGALDVVASVDRRRDPRRHGLRRQVRGRQAHRSADDRVLRQPPLQGDRQARELRRRPARLAAGQRRRRGPVRQAADASCRAPRPPTRSATPRSARAPARSAGSRSWCASAAPSCR